MKSEDMIFLLLLPFLEGVVVSVAIFVLSLIFRHSGLWTVSRVDAQMKRVFAWNYQLMRWSTMGLCAVLFIVFVAGAIGALGSLIFH